MVLQVPCVDNITHKPSVSDTFSDTFIEKYKKLSCIVWYKRPVKTAQQVSVTAHASRNAFEVEKDQKVKF